MTEEDIDDWIDRQVDTEIFMWDDDDEMEWM